MTTQADPTLEHQVVLVQNGQRPETRLDDLHDAEIAMSCNCWATKDAMGNTIHMRIAAAPNLDALYAAYNDPANHNPYRPALQPGDLLGQWKEKP